MSTNALTLTPGTVLGQHNEKSEWPDHPEDLHIPLFDTGVFINELAKLDILPKKHTDHSDQGGSEARAHSANGLGRVTTPLREGTWRGTRLAVTKIYELIEKSYSSHMDTANFEPAVPSPLTMQQKRQFFTFTNGSDNFPPHLDLARNKPAADVEPGTVQKSTLTPDDVFGKSRLLQLSTLLPMLLPQKFIARTVEEVEGAAANAWLGGMGTPDKGQQIQSVESYNRKSRRIGKDIFDLPNVGDLPDWYSDARFAQQQFTGANPVTIERASEQWIQHFSESSKDSRSQGAQQTIKVLASRSKDSLYMQDYSYFRKAANIDDAVDIKCEFDDAYRDGDQTKHREDYRYGCASVCLFYLSAAGKLLPLAIVIDWRGSADKSVTIHNNELFKRDPFLKSLAVETDKLSKKLKMTDEAHDWPWRYAKTCVQTSDWLRHEVTVHLTHTHQVEESIIVAANRQLPPEHSVFRLLYPHWQKTLSLNAAARTTLVPFIILKIIGFNEKQAYKFIQHAYETFDFQAQYVPDYLRRRGFAPEHLNDRKFHNYAYARCIHSMWYKIRQFVVDMLSIEYKGPDADRQVTEDEHIQNWSREMRKPIAEGGANVRSFPILTALNDLVDCVTMCIHIASPQHTAVNYLQNYYQAFVISKPPCLFAPPPKTLDELLGYTEKDLVAALPMNHPHEWLLASHIPYLLSFRPGDKESLIIYAASKYHVYKYKTGDDEKATAAAAARFYKALADSDAEFKGYGKEVDDSDTITYDVLSPAWNAVSILI